MQTANNQENSYTNHLIFSVNYTCISQETTFSISLNITKLFILDLMVSRLTPKCAKCMQLPGNDLYRGTECYLYLAKDVTSDVRK